MLFYRDVSAAGLDIASDQAMRSAHRILRNFTMPGFTVPEFRRKAVIIAVGGVDDHRRGHLDEGDDLGLLAKEFEEASVKFEESKQRYLECEGAQDRTDHRRQSTQNPRDPYP